MDIPAEDPAVATFIRIYRQLAPEVQKAMYWLLLNIDEVNRLFSIASLTEADLQVFTEMAKSRKDYTLLVLALYKQKKEQQEQEEEKSPTEE